VIVCAGAWTARLLPELAPLLRVTRQVQAWVAPRAGTDPAGMPCWLLDRGPRQPAVYGLAPDPRAAAADPASPSRLPKVALHGSDVLVDPDAGAAPPADRDLARVHRAYSGIAPGLAGEVAAATTCLYTMSPDGNFLLGTRRGSQRTHFAAGLSGHGFKLAPALGDALCELALNGRTRLPVGFLSPDRFG
jgi:sarcosine oxidase